MHTHTHTHTQHRYQNCARNNEYSAALDNLHRYYDMQCARALQRQLFNKHLGRSAGMQAGKYDGKVHFHYATLGLAELHHRFGHWEEAREAVYEAVKIAQEHGDSTCLQHALGWLGRLGGSMKRDGSEHAPSLWALLMKNTHGAEKLAYINTVATLSHARELLGAGARPTK